jgi:hypothetical protein
MSDEDRRDWRAIEVPEEVAASAAIPEDLDSNVVGPYSVPDTSRRRRAGVVYLIGAGVAAALIIGGLPTAMWWTAVVPLVLIGAYHLVAGWRLRVREGRALEAANREVEFPVGHASAALGFTGWRSRPVWNVLVFSADEPPTKRGLVRVDGIDAAIIESYVEDVPAA